MTYEQIRLNVLWCMNNNGYAGTLKEAMNLSSVICDYIQDLLKEVKHEEEK